MSDAAAAFAAGWALSAAPLGERFDAGILAAVLAAAEHPGPHVTEATLKLGSLTGTWKQVYDRQDDLFDAQSRKLRRIWLELLAGLDIALMVAAFRRQALMQDDGPAPGTGYDDPQARQHRRDELRALALAAVTGMLAGLTTADGWAAFLAAIEGALTAASGEGFAAALAVAAADAGAAGFDWKSAQKDGQQEPDGTETALVAGVLVSAMASVIARSLATLAAAGATAAEMTADVAGMLKDAAPLGLGLTHALASAMGTAVMAVYAAHEVKMVNWITAGDDRVCVTCSNYEKANPNVAAETPAPPLHFRCRCFVEPARSQKLPSSAFAPYLTST